MVTWDEFAQAAPELAAFGLGRLYDANDPIFEFHIERADATEWEEWATPQTRPVRRRWVAP